MESWRIVKDRTRCAQPGCPLPGSRDYFAVLELPSCVRRDLCERCFRSLEHDSAQPPLFWRGRRRPRGEQGPALDLESLRALFSRLGEVEDEGRVEVAAGLRYLVALLLLRKRVLKLVEPSSSSAEAADLVVIDPKIDAMEPVALRAPPLDEERLEALKAELLVALEA